MNDTEMIADFLSMDRRAFGEVADSYVKGDRAPNPLSEQERNVLEEEPVLSRLYLHLRGVKESIEAQVKADDVSLEYDLTRARLANEPEDRLDRIRSNAYKDMRGRLRFAIGLNAALQHVAWLYSSNHTVAKIVEVERDGLIVRFSQLAKALRAHREAALTDEEGTLDREEDLWDDEAIISLIGATPK